MSAGDLLLVRCWYHCIPYSHFGIDMGDGTVIELASDHQGNPDVAPDMETMLVRRTSLGDFARKSQIHTIEVQDPLDTHEVLLRAESKLGESVYCLVSGNCEHFARWCKTGHWQSEQVNEVRDRVLRSVTHLAVLLGASVNTRLGVVGQSAMLATKSRTATVLPSLIGEAAEYLAQNALAHSTLPPETIQRRSQAIGYGTVAIVGVLFGGPIASASALAAHAATRAAIRLAR
jgi:Lecithin retinol acyltransferase